MTNPIGPDFVGKKYLTRGGDIVQLVDAKAIGLTTQDYLWSPETDMFYEHTEEFGNLVFSTLRWEDSNDIVEEVVE